MTKEQHLTSTQSALLLAVLYGVAAWISLLLTRTPGSVAAFWYANAVAISFLMHRSATQWPWLLLSAGLANVLTNLAWGDSLLLALKFVPPNLIEIALAASLIRWAKLDHGDIEEPTRLLTLLVLGCVLAPTASALLGTTLVSVGLDQPLWSNFLPWMASSVVGGAAIFPLSVLIHRQGLSTVKELTLDPLFWGLLSVAVGMTVLVHAYLPYPFVFTVLPLMVSAMTLPMMGTAIITASVSITLGLMMLHGALVPPPTTWEWQQIFVYLAMAAALVPAQILSAARAATISVHRRLEHSARSLEKANKGLQQFIQMASHDLREPVNTVSQFASLLHEDHVQHLPANAHVHLRRISHGAERMRILLDDVTQFATLTQQAGINVVLVNLELCLSNARQKLSSVVDTKGATVSAVPLPVVWGDSALLTVLMTHLLDNALKFVPPDRRPVIHIDALCSEDLVTMRIKDNGIGIDPAYASKLFEPFARLTTRRQFSGSGLGLAVCRQIVEAHHGSISIQNEGPHGVVVEVSLPLAR